MIREDEEMPAIKVVEVGDRANYSGVIVDRGVLLLALRGHALMMTLSPAQMRALAFRMLQQADWSAQERQATADAVVQRLGELAAQPEGEPDDAA